MNVILLLGWSVAIISADIVTEVKSQQHQPPRSNGHHPQSSQKPTIQPTQLAQSIPAYTVKIPVDAELAKNPTLQSKSMSNPALVSTHAKPLLNSPSQQHHPTLPQQPFSVVQHTQSLSVHPKQPLSVVPQQNRNPPLSTPAESLAYPVAQRPPFPGQTGLKPQVPLRPTPNFPRPGGPIIVLPPPPVPQPTWPQPPPQSQFSTEPNPLGQGRSLKLYYFEFRGRGEASRLLLTYAGTQFEDIRIPHDQWPTYKEQMPLGQVPVLEVNGKRLAQSAAINRYIASYSGLLPKTSWDRARADMLVDGVMDQWNYLGSVFMPKLQGNTQLSEQNWPAYALKYMTPFFKYYSQFLNDNGGTWFVGDSITWADIAIAEFLSILEDCFNARALDSQPQLKAFSQKVLGLPQLRDYVARRPSCSTDSSTVGSK